MENELTVNSIKPLETREWLLHKHYAKRLCSISHAFGLHLGNQLIGVCTFGSPPSPSLCSGICGDEYRGVVLELNRLIVNSDVPRNSLSFLVSKSLKMLPRPKIIVSYADTSMGHHGYIYQATNFIYTGLSAQRTELKDPNNMNMHSKSVVEKYGSDTDKLIRVERPQKHRYVYFIGTKKEKKQMLSALNYRILPYPKGDNERYSADYTPQTQERLL
jgi:hypothetical protein